MSFTMFRTVVSKSTKPLIARAPARSFHSPFAVLSSASAPVGTSPLETPNPSSGAGVSAQGPVAEAYDPTLDPDVHVSPSGTRTYVVSTPDPADMHYAVPSGAYPNSSPYAHPPGETSSKEIGDLSSSTANSPAHPQTTSPHRLPTNPAGVGASAALRFRLAPGIMHEMGGSNSGEGLADEKGTRYPNKKDEPPDVNPPPLSKEGETFGKLGLKDAWKERK